MRGADEHPGEPLTTPAERLTRRIEMEGPQTFAVFMGEALYGKGGYYDRQQLAIGRDGDFVTGSSLSPLFGRSTATLVERLDHELGRRVDYLEAGYGGGEHLGAVAEALGRVDRRVVGWDRVDRDVAPGVDRVSSLDEIEAGSWSGLIFSYELFDALPVHRLVRRRGSLRELLVTRSEAGFKWEEGELSEPALEIFNDPGLEEGQLIDVTAEWATVYGRLARRLRQGCIVTCDYGFERSRLFDVRVRRNGTLACYRKQRVHRDPLVNVGRQDLTAHVDFTTLIETGESHGLETFGLFRQAEWLAATGLLDGMESRSPQERIEVMELMNLEGMGEEIRVLVQSRGVDVAKVLPSLPLHTSP